MTGGDSKKRVDKFNEIRKRELFTSHVLVYDECMSASIPR